MKGKLFVACVMLSISMQVRSQINLELRKADNDQTVQLQSLLVGADGKYKPTFLITWSGEWCFPCMDVIKSLGNAAKSGMVQVLAVNVDKNWPSIKAKGYHTSSWSNATNLYADSELKNPFSFYFTTENAPLIMFFNESGFIQFMTTSYEIRSYHFTDYFGKEFIWQDWSGLNSYAWNYYLEHEEASAVIPTTDSEMTKALEFINRSIELDKNYHNTDTYAALLFLTGQYTDALKTAKEAIDLAKAGNLDYKGTSELIEKIIEKM